MKTKIVLSLVAAVATMAFQNCDKITGKDDDKDKNTESSALLSFLDPSVDKIEFYHTGGFAPLPLGQDKLVIKRISADTLVALKETLPTPIPVSISAQSLPSLICSRDVSDEEELAILASLSSARLDYDLSETPLPADLGDWYIEYKFTDGSKLKHHFSGGESRDPSELVLFADALKNQLNDLLNSLNCAAQAL